MSAFIVSKAHIDVIVRGLCESETVPLDPTEVGRVLWNENLLSVAARYPNDVSGDRPGDGDTDAQIAAYIYQRPPTVPQTWLANAIECLNYQSCEHDGWASSDANAWITTLFTSLNNAGVHGGDDDPWGISSADLARLHAAA